MNLEEFGGMARSLLTYTAKIPSIKKSNAGFVRLSARRAKFIVVKWMSNVLLSFEH
jgi:hypothetical protein